MKIIRIWRLHFPFSDETQYAFTQTQADAIRDLFTKNHGNPVVDIVLVPVDPYFPIDTSLDPSVLVEYQDGVMLPHIDSYGLMSDPHDYIPRWKAAGWDGTIEEVTP